jgi:hypothetical protein
MTDEYQVLTEALRGHARKVGSFADRVAQAVAAAREVSLPTDAYGVCCLELPMLLNPLQQLGAVALEGGGTRLSNTATSIEDAAKGYATIDDHNALALYQARESR